ncbi:MAG TPA: GxxExxY protein [Gemmatimonadales bacterium]|nr:GxxExxY protein [Gemmatimonadales bacterium]
MRLRPSRRELRATGDANESSDPQTYAIIGAAMVVHRELGPGFLEAVYHEALAVVLSARGVPFRSQVDLPIRFQGRPLISGYRADLICFDEIIVELKALSDLGGIEEAQLLNYLKAGGLRRGLLLNFGRKSLQLRRLMLDCKSEQSP